MQDLINNFEPATEALLRKRSLDAVLDAYLKQLNKKLRTEEDCDTFLNKVKNDQSKFNDALKVMMDAKVKFDKGNIDQKQFKTLTRNAYKDISQYCKTFKVKMSDFGSGGFNAQSNITKEDIVDFKQYVTKLIAGVVSIKKQRTALEKEMNRKIGDKSTFDDDMKKAKESAYGDSFEPAVEDSICDKETLNTINTILKTVREEAQPRLKELAKKYNCPFYVRWKLNKIYEEIKKLGYKISDKHDLTWEIAQVEISNSNRTAKDKKLSTTSKEIEKIFEKTIDRVHKKINMQDKIVHSNSEWQVYLNYTQFNKYYKVEIKIIIPKESTKANESALTFEEIFNVAMESLDDNIDTTIDCK